MKILVLNSETMKKVFSMKDAIESVKLAASSYTNKKANIPLRTNLNIKKYNGDSLYMYGYVEDLDALGVKLVSVYPDNKKYGISSCPATMILENAKTGEVSSLMDGTYLTRLRTGALSGAATELMSKTNAKVFALIGTGGQAMSQLAAVLAVRDIEEVHIYSRNKDNVASFINEAKNIFKQKFIAEDSADSAIKNADIITTVTTAKDPVFDGKLVKRCCHINAVGSYTPEMSEIDEYIVLNANKIVVDTLDGTINESGDFIKPKNKGLFSIDMISGELGDLVNGKIGRRSNDDEITLFETTGSAVFDLVTAEKIYEKAIKENLGTVIEM